MSLFHGTIFKKQNFPAHSGTPPKHRPKRVRMDKSIINTNYLSPFSLLQRLQAKSRVLFQVWEYMWTNIMQHIKEKSKCISAICELSTSTGHRPPPPSPLSPHPSPLSPPPPPSVIGLIQSLLTLCLCLNYRQANP